MGLWSSIFQGIDSARDGKKSDYLYNILDDTPYLHGSEHLKQMSRGATKGQKASIMKHMVNHDVLTGEYEGYSKLYDNLMNDFE